MIIDSVNFLIATIFIFISVLFGLLAVLYAQRALNKDRFNKPHQNVMKCRFFPYDHPKNTVYVRFEKYDFPGLYKEFDKLSYEDFGNLEKNIYQEIRMYLDCMKDDSDE